MPEVDRTEVRRLRQQTGLKVSQFAVIAGVNVKTLKNIECGGGNPSEEVIHRIANALGVDADTLRPQATRNLRSAS